MTRRSGLRSLIAALAIVLLTTGCAEFIDFFEIIAYEESDDPNLRRTGTALRELKEEQEVQESLDQFLETGDPSHLDRARTLRPDDTAVRGYDVALATLNGTPDEIEAAKRRLIEAEARRLAALDIPNHPPFSAEKIRRNAMGEILVAQINLLGGSLTQDWSPPGADASDETQRLYRDYCATRNTIQTEFNDPLSYIPNPPC